MIYCNIPYCNKEEGKNLGKAYNRFMAILPNDEDYAIFLDHDAMFTTYEWYKYIEMVLDMHKDIALFTGVTNRIMCPYQTAKNINVDSNDIEYHRKVGQQLQKKHGLEVTDITNEKVRISGVLMILQKRAWKKSGGFIEKGILGVDNEIHSALRKVDEKVYLLKGLYVYHYYSNFNMRGQRDIKHLL